MTPEHVSDFNVSSDASNLSASTGGTLPCAAPRAPGQWWGPGTYQFVYARSSVLKTAPSSAPTTPMAEMRTVNTSTACRAGRPRDGFCLGIVGLLLHLGFRVQNQLCNRSTQPCHGVFLGLMTYSCTVPNNIDTDSQALFWGFSLYLWYGTSPGMQMPMSSHAIT